MEKMNTIILDYLEQPEEIFLSYQCKLKGERRFKVTKDIFVTLSDGYELLIQEGFETDLMSVPKWGWSIFAPIDAGIIGDLIHDKLWVDKQKQFEFFEYSSYKARKFADEERLRWREAIVPNKKIKNKVTHFFIRKIGGFFYSKQLQIPN